MRPGWKFLTHLQQTIVAPSLPPPKSSAQPKDYLNEEIFFNEENFEKYLNLVKLCTDAFETSESSDVLAEGPSMIAKMRGLLDPLVKFEVDYNEAIKDVSNECCCRKEGFCP